MSNVTRGRYTYYRMIKDGTALIIAVAFGHFEVVRYLLEQGADRDKAVRDGATPLHYAAEYGRLKIAKLLMVYGADLNVRDRLDRLPIDMRIPHLNIDEITAMTNAIRDEPRRRMDHGHKRATEQDLHQETDHEEAEEESGQQSNKRPRLDEEEVQKGKLADEDQDSESSSDEEDN